MLWTPRSSLNRLLKNVRSHVWRYYSHSSSLWRTSSYTSFLSPAIGGMGIFKQSVKIIFSINS
jgi:hypothetical protein